VPCAYTADVILQGTAAIPSNGSGEVYVCITPQPAVTTPNKPVFAAIVLMNSIFDPVDTVSFVLQWDRSAIELVGITSSLCAVTERVDSLGKVRVLLQGCSFPLAAGMLCTAEFLPMFTANDTTVAIISTDSVYFYPQADSIIAGGCSVPVTILPVCDIHGVVYVDSATTISQNYPNPFAGTTTIAANKAACVLSACLAWVLPQTWLYFGAHPTDGTIIGVRVFITAILGLLFVSHLRKAPAKTNAGE